MKNNTAKKYVPVLLTLAVLLTSCGKDKQKNSSVQEPTTQVAEETINQEESTTTLQAVQKHELCQGITSTIGTVENSELIETSGIAISEQHPDILWAHNDSGSKAGVYALDLTGKDLGFFALPDIQATDIEAIATHDGKIFLADIGNNIFGSQKREYVTIFEFEEPNPKSPQEIQSVTQHQLLYPSGFPDAEAFFIDPQSGNFFIIEKPIGLMTALGSLSDASIFRHIPTEGGTEKPQVIEKVGSLPLQELDEKTKSPKPDSEVNDYGITGLVTGADNNQDGSLIALRTYATVWLYSRVSGQTIEDALAQEPCEAPSVLETQGEAVSLSQNEELGSFFLTIGEGNNSSINQTIQPTS